MREIDDLTDIEVLALTLWGEARGESILGRSAVACVIINRVEANGWYGKNIREVCLKKWQFSCWNGDDPNRSKILNVPSGDKQLKECAVIAELAAQDALQDFTKGSKHYHTADIEPGWSKDLTPVFQLGSHVYFNDVD